MKKSNRSTLTDAERIFMDRLRRSIKRVRAVGTFSLLVTVLSFVCTIASFVGEFPREHLLRWCAATLLAAGATWLSRWVYDQLLRQWREICPCPACQLIRHLRSKGEIK